MKKQLLLAFVLAVLAGAGLHLCLRAVSQRGHSPVFTGEREHLGAHQNFILALSGVGGVAHLGRPTGLRPWLLTGVGICLAMLAVGYLLHVVLGWNSLAADLVLYGVLMALGFWLPTRMAGPFQGLRWHLPALLAALLVAAMVWFTFCPPQGALFTDSSQESGQQMK